MQLMHAVRNNGPSLAKAQTSYKENVVAVNTLICSVLKSNLPTLNQTPPDWSDFVTAHEQANTTALEWVNQVMARLLEVPDDVQSYNGIVVSLLEDASRQASALISNPNDKPALESLKHDLNSVVSQLNLCTDFITGCVTHVRNFKDHLPSMASTLQDIANKSVKDANADKQAIDNLNDKIDQLRKDIKSLTASIVALAIADGIALTIGVVTTIALWPVGAVVWFVMGPAVVAATTYIALDAEKIKADKAAIEGAESQITSISADVATLQVLSKNYGNMAGEAGTIEDNLQAILTAWQAMESEVAEAVSDINTALDEADADQFQAVKNDIDAAIGAWNDTYNKAGALHLDLQANNAELGLGMSQQAVESALADGTTMDLIRYLNEQSTTAVTA